MRKPPRWFAALALVALALRALLWWQYRGSPFARSPVGDEANYWEWAARIAAGEWRPAEAFYQGPLFPYLLALLKTAFPGFGQMGLAALQLLLDWVTCLLFLPLVRPLAGERVALAASSLALFFAPGAFFALKGVPNTVGLFLLAAGLVVLPKGGGRWGGRCALSGALLGLAVLAVPSAALVLAAAAGYLLLRPPGQRRWLPPLVLALAALAAVSPAAAANRRADGSLALVSTNFGQMFWLGNHPGAWGGYSLQPGFSPVVGEERVTAADAARREAGRPLNASQVSAHFLARGARFAAGDPAGWLWLEARKGSLLLAGLDVPHEFSLARERRDFLPLLWAFPVGGIGAVLLGCLGLAGGLAPREERRGLLLFVLGAAAFAAIGLLFYVANRFAHPFQLLLLPAAGAGLLALPRLKARPAGALALLPAAGCAALWWGPLHDPFWEVRDYLPKLALAYERAGELPRAAATLQRMAGLAPEDPVVFALAGTMYQRHGDPEFALASFDRALALDPGSADSWFGRALALTDLGRGDEALAALDKALALDTGYETARARREELRREIGRSR